MHNDVIWTNVGLVASALVCLGLTALALGARLRQAAVEFAVSARKTPVRAVLAVLALGALVSYAGTKPPEPVTTYTVKFVLPQAFEPIESLACEPEKVYNLPAVDGYRWKSSANDRLYDGGLLIFNLAQPGETVTMTAVRE